MPSSDISILVFGELLAHLRRSGFLIGVDEYLHVQTVLNRTGGLTKEGLKTVLCPLLASNKEQQRLFNEAFDRYFELYAPVPPAVLPQSATDQPEGAAPKRHRYVLSALLLLILTGLLIFALRPRGGEAPQRGTVASPSPSLQPSATATPGLPEINGNVSTPPPAVIITPSPSPSPSPTPEPAKRLQSYVDLIRLTAVLAAIIILAAYAWSRLDRREYIRRQQADREPPLTYEVEVGVPPPKIFTSEKFYRAARLLRRRQAGEFHRIDIPATISATVQSLGYPSLRYRPDSLTPEYLLLIDRASLRDHRAHLYDEMASALAREDLFVERYFYEVDPRLCCDESGGKCFTLTELQNKHRDHRVLIFGDGEKLVDSSTGELAAWTSLFSGWESVSLHTPEHPTNWGLREVSIAARFAIMPATIEGLLGLARHYESPLRTDLRRWLREDTGLPPPPPDLERGDVVGALRGYLSEETFDWLCACAIHTELQWNLTLYLGSLPAVGADLLTEENLLRLFGLPWFRNGLLPGDLRALLIEELDKKSEKALAIRAAVVELLLKKAPPAKTYAANAYGVFLAVQRWLLDRDDTRKLRELLQLIKSLPRAQVIQDPALVPALKSAPSHFFDQRLPGRLRQFLYRNGIPAFGIKPRLLASLIVLALALTWLSAPSIARALFEEPRTSVEQTTPTPTPTPTLNPTPTLTPSATPSPVQSPSPASPTPTPTVSPTQSPAPTPTAPVVTVSPTQSPSRSPTGGCPKVSVNCPEADAQAGVPITFTANVSGGPSAVTFNWAISSGTIVGGQGTPAITVDTTGLDGQSVTATVQVGGIAPECFATASCTASISGTTGPSSRKFDVYGNIAYGDEQARLDNWAIQLQNEPGAQGYMICYGGRGGRAGEAQRRCDRAKDYLVNTRGIDPGRVTLVVGGLKKELTVELWIVPSGAVAPPDR